MDSIRLKDYDYPRKYYLLDRLTGEHRAESRTPDLPMSGFAMELPIRLRRRQAIFVALYAAEDSLWFRVDATEFNLTDRVVQVKKTSPFPFVRRLEVTRGAEVLLSADFWIQRGEFSSFPEGDFLDFVAEETRTQSGILRAIPWWTARGKGQHLTDPAVQDELERRYQLAIREQAASATDKK